MPLPVTVRDLSAKWFHLCHCWLSISTACGVWCMCVICVTCVIVGCPPQQRMVFGAYVSFVSFVFIAGCPPQQRMVFDAYVSFVSLVSSLAVHVTTHGLGCMCVICVLAAWQPAADLVQMVHETRVLLSWLPHFMQLLCHRVPQWQA